MKTAEVTGRLSHADVECADRLYPGARCSCLFWLMRGERVIAATPSAEAHEAARRLLGGKS